MPSLPFTGGTKVIEGATATTSGSAAQPGSFELRLGGARISPSSSVGLLTIEILALVVAVAGVGLLGMCVVRRALRKPQTRGPDDEMERAPRTQRKQHGKATRSSRTAARRGRGLAHAAADDDDFEGMRSPSQLEDDTNSFGLDEALDAILRKHGGPNARYGGLDQEDAENDDA